MIEGIGTILAGLGLFLAALSKSKFSKNNLFGNYGSFNNFIFFPLR
jgi:hypothetical protein